MDKIERSAGGHADAKAACCSDEHSQDQTVAHHSTIPSTLLPTVPSADLDRVDAAASTASMDDQTLPLSPLQAEAELPVLLGEQEQQIIATAAEAAASNVDDSGAHAIEADEHNTTASRPKLPELPRGDVFGDAPLPHTTFSSSDAAPETSASPPEPSALDQVTAAALTEISRGIGPGGLRLPHCSDLADLLRLPLSPFVSCSIPFCK